MVLGGFFLSRESNGQLIFEQLLTMSSSCAKRSVPRRRLQITLADTALLMFGVACGLWNVRVSGILDAGSLPTSTYALLLLDYFVWGLSFVGPVVVVLNRLYVPRAEKSA